MYYYDSIRLITLKWYLKYAPEDEPESFSMDPEYFHFDGRIIPFPV